MRKHLSIVALVLVAAALLVRLLVTGIVLPNDIPVLVLGLFFADTGYRKLFNPTVHANVFGLFARLKVPLPAAWAVVLGEYFGGLGLLSGVLQPWAAAGLIPIVLGAYVMDTIPTIKKKFGPCRDFDGATLWCSKLICNFELLALMFLIIIAAV